MTGRRLIVLLPLICFLALAALFLFRLGAGDPVEAAVRADRSPGARYAAAGGSQASFATARRCPVSPAQTSRVRSRLVNVWASWCVPCHDEAGLVMKLADDKRIRIIGINYKDQPENARRFIGRYGNPFAAVGADVSGRAAIDWGVYGVPETFVIGKDGRIAYKLVWSDQRRTIWKRR